MENSNQTKIFFKLNHSDRFYHSFKQCLRRGIDLNYLSKNRDDEENTYEIIIEAVELINVVDFKYTFPIERVLYEMDKCLRDNNVIVEGNFATSCHFNDGYLNRGFLAPVASLFKNAVSDTEKESFQNLINSLISKYSKDNIWSFIDNNKTPKDTITVSKQEEDDFQRHNKLSERLIDWVNQLLNNQSQPLNATE